MDRSALHTFIGNLTNDPNHDRYTTAMINVELDNVQNRWNVTAGMIKDTVTLTVVDGTREYDLSTLTGTPIRFLRVAHKGLDLKKKDKTWFDLYTDEDWTTLTGTPKRYYIEAEDPDVQQIVLQPIPQGADAGANLVVEYIKQHTAMASDSSEPWNGNTFLRPYHPGLGKEVAAELLSRDPSDENIAKAQAFYVGANGILQEVINYYEALEAEEPPRMTGGRYW